MSGQTVMTVEVLDPIGFHARPVGQVVSRVRQSGLDVVIRRPGTEGVVANSPLKLLAMKVKNGEYIEIVAPGDDDVSADLVRELAELINAEAP